MLISLNTREIDLSCGVTNSLHFMVDMIIECKGLYDIIHEWTDKDAFLDFLMKFFIIEVQSEYDRKLSYKWKMLFKFILAF